MNPHEQSRSFREKFAHLPAVAVSAEPMSQDEQRREVTVQCDDLARFAGLPTGTALIVRIDNAQGVAVITAISRDDLVTVRMNGAPRDLAHGGRRMYDTGCRCGECVSGNSRRRNRKEQRGNSLTRETAVNNGKQWTGPEMEIAACTDLTAREVAVILGRTMKAVRSMRVKLMHDPRYRDVAGAASTI